MLVSEACWIEAVLEDLCVLHKVAPLPFLVPGVCDVPSVARMFENLRREQPRKHGHVLSLCNCVMPLARPTHLPFLRQERGAVAPT